MSLSLAIKRLLASQFLGRSDFLDTKGLKLPQDAKNWLQRLQDNLVFYFGNYLVVAICLILLLGVCALFSSSQPFSVGVLTSFLMGSHSISGNKPFTISAIVFFFIAGILLIMIDDGLKLGSVSIGFKEKIGIVSAGTQASSGVSMPWHLIFSLTEFLLSLYLTETSSSWAYALLLCILFIFAHGSLKQRSGLRPLQKEADTVNFHINKMAESLAETNRSYIGGSVCSPTPSP